MRALLTQQRQQRSEQVARWPSGLRRCVKAAISSEAWVRTPPSSHVLLGAIAKAPPVGLEPTTTRLRALRSTD